MFREVERLYVEAERLGGYHPDGLDRAEPRVEEKAKEEELAAIRPTDLVNPWMKRWREQKAIESLEKARRKSFEAALAAEREGLTKLEKAISDGTADVLFGRRGTGAGAAHARAAEELKQRTFEVEEAEKKLQALPEPVFVSSPPPEQEKLQLAGSWVHKLYQPRPPHDDLETQVSRALRNKQVYRGEMPGHRPEFRWKSDIRQRILGEPEPDRSYFGTVSRAVVNSSDKSEMIVRHHFHQFPVCLHTARFL